MEREGGYELRRLTRLPPELARLTSLQSLDLYGCRQLSDLSPLATLTSLQTLNLSMRSAHRRPLPAGRPHLAPIARPLQLRSAQRRSLPAGPPHLAPIARPRQVPAAQRRSSPLAALTSLQSLDLPSAGTQRRPIPASGLTSLQTLTSPIAGNSAATCPRCRASPRSRP